MYRFNIVTTFKLLKQDETQIEFKEPFIVRLHFKDFPCIKVLLYIKLHTYKEIEFEKPRMTTCIFLVYGWTRTCLQGKCTKFNWSKALLFCIFNSSFGFQLYMVLYISDRPGVTMHPAQPDWTFWPNRKCKQILLQKSQKWCFICTLTRKSSMKMRILLHMLA